MLPPALFFYLSMELDWNESTITAATYWPIVPVMIVEQLVERVAEETEVLGENLAQYRSVHYRSHMT
jgi:hypothetical protein